MSTRISGSFSRDNRKVFSTCIMNHIDSTRSSEQKEVDENRLFALNVNDRTYRLYLPNAGEDYIQTKITEEGIPYEDEMLSDMMSRLESNDLVLDIGAHIGNHTFYLSEVADCKVVAFEANVSLADAMRVSIEANHCESRVRVENVALGEHGELGEFEAVIPENIGAQRLICGKGDITVKALNHFSFEQPVAMLKIDVEGMELAVLKGAKELIVKDEPVIYVESRDLDDFSDIQDFLSSYGYVYWDTFNATPTHLFLPKHRTDLTGTDFGDAHLKSALKSYSLAKVKRNYMVLKAQHQEYIGLRERLEEQKKVNESQHEELIRAKKKISEEESAGRELKEKVGCMEDTLAEQDGLLNGLKEQLASFNSLVESQRDEFKIKLRQSELKRSGHYQKLDQLRSEYGELEKKYRELEPEYERQKRQLEVSEQKRSGHYRNLQVLRAEIGALRRTRAFRFQRLLSLSKTPRGLLLFPIGLFKVLFLGVPKRNAGVENPRHSKQELRNSDASTQTVASCLKVKSSLERVDTNQLIDVEKATLLGWPDIPESKKNMPRVMAIMDEFTTGCFGDEAALIQPRPDNWKALFRKESPDLVFVESAWKGNFGSWQYRVAKYANKPGNEVFEMTEFARTKATPSIFWNKEDPVHHDKFMDAARLADVIFTTDANMIPSYVEKTGNSNVYALPFAAQPKLHFPAPLNGRIKKSCFAGTWYGDRHQARGEAMQWMLKAALPLGLDIFDRNFQTENFNFPEAYHSSIRGGLPYQELCEEYRRYRVFINVNSVIDSPTMFSRRVFELLACGTPVVSSYAKGIEEMFGRDVVWMVDSEEEAKEAIEVLLNDDEEWMRRSEAGIRAVFSEHTYMHRMKHMYEVCGLDWPSVGELDVCVIVELHSYNDIDLLREFLSSQSFREFSVFALSSKSIELDQDDYAIRVVNCSSNRAELVEQLDSEKNKVFAFIDLQSKYDENYLQDLHHASIYASDADVWTKVGVGEKFSDVDVANLFASLVNQQVCIKILTQQNNKEVKIAGRVFKLDESGVRLSGASKQKIVRTTNIQGVVK